MVRPTCRAAQRQCRASVGLMCASSSTMRAAQLQQRRLHARIRQHVPQHAQRLPCAAVPHQSSGSPQVDMLKVCSYGTACTQSAAMNHVWHGTPSAYTVPYSSPVHQHMAMCAWHNLHAVLGQATHVTFHTQEQVRRAITGTERGKSASPAQRASINALLAQLEAANSITDPATSPLLQGWWALLYQGQCAAIHCV